VTTGIVGALRRDSELLGIGARVAWRMRKMRPVGTFTAASLVEQWADRTPNAVAIRFEGRDVTYAELNADANRYANWAHSCGLGRGDVIALLMENRPEYMACWLGLAKVGAIGALLNTNLTGASLAHCVRVSKAHHLILGDELRESWAGACEELEETPRIWLVRNEQAESEGIEEGWSDLDAALAQVSREADRGLRDGLTAADKLFYIYTSGTTGNPKAANISHFRFLSVAAGLAALTRARASDRMYVVLPLYHSAGGMCAVGLTLVAGGTIVLRRKFSASHFWTDCQAEGVTLFQYIGELCRYLLNAPERPGERDHQLRLCLGNGLRPDIWEPFQERFGIPKILEFYGATEGNVALFNTDGRVGAVGRIPPLMRRVMNVRLLKFDHEREEPVRAPDGTYVESEPGEPGEVIGLIPASGTLGTFEGYTDESATAKKVLRDVFEKGDTWFRTGDLMRCDEEGYFYFVDRTGDTFRWKGENVSTSEVSEVLGRHPGVREANVYGVEVPGTDGRAGMASLVVDSDFDLRALHATLARELASYARPLFIRLQREMQVTGTFKHRKVDLVEDGFDPKLVPDLLYFDDPEEGGFVPLDGSIYERVISGQVRI
jgi:fatty-acyl-CoA synthase